VVFRSCSKQIDHLRASLPVIRVDRSVFI